MSGHVQKMATSATYMIPNLNWQWSTMLQKQFPYSKNVQCCKSKCMEEEATKSRSDKKQTRLQKSFTSPKHGHFQELQQVIMESVHLNRNMCCLHVRQWNIKQGNLQDHTKSSSIISKPAWFGLWIWCTEMGSYFIHHCCDKLASRLQGELFCFSAICDKTSEKKNNYLLS